MKMTPAAAAGLLLLVLPLPGRDGSQAPVPDRYRQWLDEEVVYIITSRERDVFRVLGTDRERDIFIDAFWKQRDPTPGTPANEYREEHYRRFRFANETYGRSAPGPGWRTDRGKIHIILGPPKTIEQYDSVNNVFPTEIWFYLGDPSLGLPAGFHVIFFRENGTGDYILYSPAQHGPRSLIATGLLDYQDERSAYRELQKLEPNLARQTLSLIPDERVMPGSVSLASERLMGTIIGSPQRRVADSYADALLRFKDVIEVEYSANYIGSDACLYVVRDASGEYFVHYAVEPRKISVVESAGGYEARFELNGRVTDGAGRTVFQFDRVLPVSVGRDGLQDLGAKSVALQDLFPLVPGAYTFDLLLKNPASKEFTSFTAKVAVPADPPPLQLTPLLIGYGAEPKPREAEKTPFRIAGRQILCPARKTFAARDTQTVFFQALGLTDDLRAKGRIRLVWQKDGREVAKKDREVASYGTGPDILEFQELRAFAPGYYEVEATLAGPDGRAVRSAKEIFEVSAFPEVPRPLIVSRVMAEAGREALLYLEGLQFLGRGEVEAAEARLAGAHLGRPERADYAYGYAQALYLRQNYERTREVLAPFAGPDAEPSGEILALLGRACHALGRFAEAAAYYEAFLGRNGATTEILNFLGTCQFELGNRDQALGTWDKSLELNPDQPRIRNLVDSIRKK